MEIVVIFKVLMIITGLVYYITTFKMMFQIKEKSNHATMLVMSGYWIFNKLLFHEGNDMNFLIGRISFSVFMPSIFAWLYFSG